MTAISGTDTGTNGAISGASSMFGLIAPTSGNHTLACTWSTAAQIMQVAAVSFTGVNQTSVAVAFPHGGDCQ